MSATLVAALTNFYHILWVCLSGMPGFHCDPVVDTCFLHVITYSTWQEAWDYCRTMGMYMVATESQDKLDVVASAMFNITGDIL